MNLEKMQQQAVEFQRKGRVSEAMRLFNQILKTRPSDFVSLYSMAVIAAQGRQSEKALSYFDRAVKSNPAYALAWHSRGVVLQDLKRYDEALESFDRALNLDPADYSSLYAKSVIALEKGDTVLGLKYIDQSLEINPRFAPSWYNRGVVLQSLKRHGEALESFDRALEADPRHIGSLINRGTVLQELYRHKEALQNYDNLLAFDPVNQIALGNRGIILTEMNRHEEAIENFRMLIEVNPGYDYAWGLLYFAQLYICKWQQLDTYLAKIRDGVANGEKVCKSLPLLAMSDASQDHQRCAEIFARHRAPLRGTAAWTGGKYRHDKIRIAYVSPDLREHPVGHLMAGIFENHDKSKFETVAIFLDVSDRSRLHSRIAATFDHYIDAYHMSSAEIASLMRSLEVDIAVDLSGYTANSRPDLFTLRPAPVQVNYLGYPSTMGLECIDYIIADRCVIPEKNREFFTEKVVYLPDAYLPTDANLCVAEETPSRETFGLPEEGFVFCSFNHSYKINPEIFEVWMRILKRVPGSVLWLMKLNPLAEENLRQEAQKRGVDPARLIFATRVPRVEDHLARYRIAGIFLDTTPYNAHTTASDALFVGCPVLTCLGRAFPGRVAASLLQAIGMPELITGSLQEYEELAVRLAQDPARLQGIKAKLAANRESYPLFDTKEFCRNLESAYTAMWERHQRDEAPESFGVPRQKALPAPEIEPATAPAPQPVESAPAPSAQASPQPSQVPGIGEEAQASAPKSQIDLIIAPEIKDDEIHRLIEELAQLPDVKTILEIGSSAGGGSTSAFVAGVLRNPNRPTLFCMEVSGPRFEVLSGTYREIPNVRCYRASSVPRSVFPNEAEVEAFYLNTPTNLNAYPLPEILRWLRQDLEYLRDSGVNEEGIRTIKRENGIDTFDMVLIDGSEFSGKPELEEVYGARWILLDDTNAFKNYENYQRLLQDPAYRLVKENQALRNGYAVFQKVAAEAALPAAKDSGLPVHFFTIVLNGEPFIRYHLDVFQNLPFDWHWHIVEGVADLKHDTAWSVKNGGRIDDSFHRNGLSNDGTSEYLDELQSRFPDRVTVYRKPAGSFWDGKLEMVNAPLSKIAEECLLWQVDVDEFWTYQQICTARDMFIEAPERRSAFYWCRFFVGPKLMVNSRYCYSQNPSFEWQRTWRYTPGCRWSSHEPPQLVDLQGGARPLSEMNPFLHNETERKGLVFQHFAYVLPEQLKFKERYYGYAGAVARWSKLQKETKFPVLLKDFFPWVHDGTTVDRTLAQGIVPIVLPSVGPEPDPAKVKIVLDGVFLQDYRTGIARVWLSLLKKWAGTPFADALVILDREGTFPRVEGFRYRVVPRHDYAKLDEDRRMLQQVCDEEGASLFVSTYFSHPVSTPSLQMVHDMIPELLRADPSYPMWSEKKKAIEYAGAYLAVSHNTALDLSRLYPRAAAAGVTVAHNGIDESFAPASAAEVEAFRKRYGIDGPYFLHVGSRGSYKNVGAIFRALVSLPESEGCKVVCTGPPQLESELAPLLPASKVVMTGILDDVMLRAAYGGAVALVYPSMIEGFGLPVLEAMACGCPVITSRHPALVEVAGDAALCVRYDDGDELMKAMLAVENGKLRKVLVERGLKRARQFSWGRMAREVMQACLKAANRKQ